MRVLSLIGVLACAACASSQTPLAVARGGSSPRSTALTSFVDSAEQMLVLCDRHHRSSGQGVHMITGPIWELQRYERGDWDFTGGGAVVVP